MFNDSSFHLSAFIAFRGGSAPPGPPRQGSPCTCFGRLAVLARGDDGVPHYMTAVAFFAVGDTESAAFFIRFDSRRSTPGGCFPQRSLSATNRSLDYMRAILRNLFRRPCATFYGRAGLRFGRAPQGSARPLTRGRAMPCTCPASPFMAKQGLCFSRDFAEANNLLFALQTYIPLFAADEIVFLQIFRERRHV